MNEDLGNKFQLAARFVELLADRAMRTGHVAPSWEKLPPAWKSIFAATVLAFLEERGCGLIANEAMSEKQEDEQIRLFCEGLTARRRLYTGLAATWILLAGILALSPPHVYMLRSVSAGAVAVLAATILGNWIPGSVFEPYFSLGKGTTVLALAGYGFIASVLPVWMLLCPREK